MTAWSVAVYGLFSSSVYRKHQSMSLAHEELDCTSANICPMTVFRTAGAGIGYGVIVSILIPVRLVFVGWGKMSVTCTTLYEPATVRCCSIAIGDLALSMCMSSIRKSLCFAHDANLSRSISS